MYKKNFNLGHNLCNLTLKKRFILQKHWKILNKNLISCVNMVSDASLGNSVIIIQPKI